VVGPSDVTLYALWVESEATFTVSYDANGGSGAAPEDTRTYRLGDEVTVAGPAGLSRVGYSFNGWNTAADGTGSAHPVGATLIMGADGLTLYASWRMQASMAAGDRHAAAVLSDGTLYTWGDNASGQLGHGDTAQRDLPTLLRHFPPAGAAVTAIALGGDHTLALLSDGRLYAWGANSDGQLGDGTTDDRDSPTLVPDFPPAGSVVTALAAGGSHSLALLDDGRLYAWGANGSGQLGDGTTSRRLTPRLVPEFPLDGVPVTAVTAGDRHTLAVLADGRLFGWGSNTDGQLARARTLSQRTSALLVEGLPSDGVQLSAVTAGGRHSVALMSDGSVYAWGYNVWGQLGDGTDEWRTAPTPVLDLPPPGSLITAIAAGSAHTLALASDGSVYTWGNNLTGQLGREAEGESRRRPGNVPDFPTLGRGASAVAAGAAFTLALLDDGSLYAWGNNDVGQLGIGTSGFDTDRTTPTPVVAPLRVLSYTAE